jgi:serine/threonine protein kinase/Tol biopolymer transport system component
MSLAPGTRLGPYEVLAAIGAGGMGAVYKARDTRLERVVAVKVILATTAATIEFRERFDREARAISALDHPHICALHDVGHERVPAAGGAHQEIDFLVMQFLEGETLADRLARASRPTSDPSIAASRPASEGGSTVSTVSALSTVSRGPLPVDVALRYAAEIADALDAAHRRGIVHRDLKPGNVMLTKAGTKLLDFGLAKLAAGPISGFEGGATRTSPFAGVQGGPLTGQGIILGTLHYMSPEQLEGREVDARSDIFSFGALLFEMLSGRRAFEGPSHAGVIAAIIGADPPELGDLADPKTRLPVVPRRALDRLLRKCLARDRDDRWQSAADLADELRWINEERLRAAAPDAAQAPAPLTAPASVSRRREGVWMVTTGLAVAAAIALAVWLYPRPEAPLAPVSFTVGPQEGTTLSIRPGLLAVSPDGQQIAFTTGESPTTRVWLRAMGSLEARPVPAADGAWHVIFSPDGRSIAFTGIGGQSGLRRVDLAGGPARTLADDAVQRAAWSPEGVILFTRRTDRRLMRVAEAGGPATPATELDTSREEAEHAWPVFLPDGRRFVFLARSRDSAKGALFLASLDSSERTHLVDVLSMPEYVPGYLLYHREGALMAHPFDERAGRLTGDPIPIVESVQFNAENGRAAIATSRSGVLAYRSGDALSLIALPTWFDRTGKRTGTIGQADRYLRGALAPDGRRFVVPIVDNASRAMDLFMIDVDRGISSRFTSDSAVDNAPLWTNDGESVVFSSNRKGALDLFIKSAGGAVPERVLFESADDKYAHGFSPDGKLLAFSSGSAGSRRLWVLPMTGEAKPYRLFPESSESLSESSARFSPDGKWIAYVGSTGPQAGNVFVQPFPPSGYREQISATYGNAPVWTSDSRQIAFVGPENSIMMTAVTPEGSRLRVGIPQRLFAQRQSVGAVGFTMSDQGDRFLLVVRSGDSREDDQSTLPLTVVLNWPGLVKR